MENTAKRFEEIDIHAAQKIIDQGHVTLVDIRDPQAYETAHIANALSVNDSNVEEFLRTADKDRPLLCYCYHGMSSRSAAEYFNHNGFKKVYSITGGFEEWRKVYPSVKGQ